MGFNKYRWFSKGKTHKPLPKSAHLLDRIRNGDFDLSSYYKEAKQAQKDYQKIYKREYDSHATSDTNVKRVHAHAAARMRNVARLKLEEEGMVDEIRILKELRDSLKAEFDADLWDEATSPEIGNGTIEDIYVWYKEKLGIQYTNSDIKQIRKRMRKPKNGK